MVKTAELLKNISNPVLLTAEICDIASESGSEKTLADAIYNTLAVHAPHLTLYRDGDCVIARTAGSARNRVLVAGHIDTVPINKNLPVREITIAGEQHLWGRGTVDMKAGVAVQLVAAIELKNPAAEVTWVWYDHEEVSSELNGLGRALRNNPELFAADLAILGEPTNAGIEGGCNGTLRAEITYSGKRAHSARSWRGVNAIHRAHEALAKLAAYQAELIEVDGLAYQEGLNAVRIRGGIAGNVIPDSCTIEVNYRFAPAKTIAEASAFITEFFSGADNVEFVDLASGARPGLDAPLAQQLVTATGSKPVAKVGWTDVARFSELGIPALNYGPGDPQLAHADDEAVSIQQINAVYAGLKQFLTSEQMR